jgi:maltose alpha-D-glucosyltransferase/alpha-amylase
MQSLWYTDAVIYQIYVPACCDGDADGIGDVPGLLQKLDYLEQLGVSAVCLLGLDPSHRWGVTSSGRRQESMHDGHGPLRDFKTFVSQVRGAV